MTPDERTALNADAARATMRRWAPYGPADADAQYDADLDAFEAAARAQVAAEHAALVEAAWAMPTCDHNENGTYCFTYHEDVPCCGDDLAAALTPEEPK